VTTAQDYVTWLRAERLDAERAVQAELEDELAQAKRLNLDCLFHAEDVAARVVPLRRLAYSTSIWKGRAEPRAIYMRSRCGRTRRSLS